MYAIRNRDNQYLISLDNYRMFGDLDEAIKFQSPQQANEIIIGLDLVECDVVII